MFVLYFALLLAEISWSTEGAFVFTQQPTGQVYFLKGTNATLEWDYSVDDRAAELEFIIWRVENKSNSGDFDPLLYEKENFEVVVSSKIPKAYLGRVEKKDRATLVIKNIRFEDSTTYTCVLQGKGLLGNLQSDVKLVVTGPASVRRSPQFAEVGASVTFTCNATYVPSAHFTWMRKGQTENITSDARHTIVSVTGSSQLTIKNITTADHGHYICDATVDLQANTAPFYLQVLRKLTEQVEGDGPCPKRFYFAAVGDQSMLTICCPVSGYPPPVVTWEKNGNELQKGENALYTISGMKDKDFGNYSCTATAGKTTIGPLIISVMKKEAELPVKPIDGTPTKPAKLEWVPHPGADNYVVKINGTDIFDDYLIGTETSLEFYYDALVMKKAGKKPEEIDICVDVSAMSNNGILAKTPICQQLTVKLPSDTEN